ncbi:Uncharacterised protein [Pseudomonas aeruginosa]|nr:Uncharacterised protein [Pseudomonas aeruginosa]
MLGLDGKGLPLGIDELMQRTEALLARCLRQRPDRYLPATGAALDFAYRQPFAVAPS